MTTSKGKRAFTIQLVKGSKPTDLVRMVHDQPFDGSIPSGPRFSNGYNCFVRVLPMTEAAAIINADIKAGTGVSPLTDYVDSI